jgi:hypothetical protein
MSATFGCAARHAAFCFRMAARERLRFFFGLGGSPFG